MTNLSIMSALHVTIATVLLSAAHLLYGRNQRLDNKPLALSMTNLFMVYIIYIYIYILYIYICVYRCVCVCVCVRKVIRELDLLPS